GITYKHNGGNKIHGYSDSSYEVNTQEGKGTTGIIFYYRESPISWSTQKQATIAFSSCESEFIAATAAATQTLWLKRLLSKLTHTQEEKITIQVNNKSAIELMKNPVFHGRSKHIDTNSIQVELHAIIMLNTFKFLIIPSGGSRESRVEPIKEEEKAVEVAVTTKAKVCITENTTNDVIEKLLNSELSCVC
nr:ribonuclease H-like domain, reverse transcriptase, RNA-dependent DNA polymerase [Tanacetum cinerariifolium]